MPAEHDDDVIDTFDPDNVEDFLLDCEMHFDSYPAVHGKPARYDTMPAMLSYAVKATSNREFRETMRDWQRYGIPLDSKGSRQAVRDCEWKDYKRALIEIYPVAPLADSAADSLADLKQSTRVVQHNAVYTRLAQEAGEVVDLENESNLPSSATWQRCARSFTLNWSTMTRNQFTRWSMRRTQKGRSEG